MVLSHGLPKKRNATYVHCADFVRLLSKHRSKAGTGRMTWKKGKCGVSEDCFCLSWTPLSRTPPTTSSDCVQKAFRRRRRPPTAEPSGLHHHLQGEPHGEDILRSTIQLAGHLPRNVPRVAGRSKIARRKHSGFGRRCPHRGRQGKEQHPRLGSETLGWRGTSRCWL